MLTACNGARDAVATADEPRSAAVQVDAGEPDLGLTAPEDGFLIRSLGADYAPGEEHEHCEVGRIPGEPTDEYYVSLIQLANGKGSHHLGLAAAARGSTAEAELEALGVGNRRDCPGPLLAFGEGIEVLGTTQVPYGEVGLPSGVARKFHGGQFIVFNYHYVNTTLETLKARSAAAFHLVDPATVDHLAQLLSLNNVTIDVAPGETASFTAECHFHTDMMVGGLTRHTHGLGTDFSVWYAGGPRDGEEIWTSHDWETETDFAFPEPVMLKAGEGLRYSCSYANGTNQRVRFGTTAKDEMCMLYGPAWSVRDDEPLDLPDCHIVWIDDDGIGHPATEAGGFPKPSAAQAALCRAAYGSSIDDCARCRCDSCAGVGLQCSADPDCSALFRCLAACTDLECTEACQPTVQKHSAGQGLLTAVAQCAIAECPMCGST